MEDFVRSIEACWLFRLLSIVSSIVGVIAGLFAIATLIGAWFKIAKPYSSLPKLKNTDGEPVVLGIQHCESPGQHELKGKTVVATGIVTAFDSQTQSMQLHAFPFSVRAKIVCELASDERASLNPLDLVSAIGTAADNVDDDGSRCKLHLTNCHVRRPVLSDRIRHWLLNGPIGGPIRHWWYFGWF